MITGSSFAKATDDILRKRRMVEMRGITPLSAKNSNKWLQVYPIWCFWSVNYELAKYWLLSWQFVWNTKANAWYFIARVMTFSPKFRDEFWLNGLYALRLRLVKTVELVRALWLSQLSLLHLWSRCFLGVHRLHLPFIKGFDVEDKTSP